MPVGGIFLSCSPCSYHSCNFHPDSTFISCPDHSFYINMQLFFTSCNQLADGISHRRKLFFIFCHDISHHHILLVMQIKGMCQKSPSFRFCHFLEGKFKQIFIVRFKFYRFTSCQNLTVTSQKFSGSQSSFCMTCLWPRIRKIQINTLYLSFFKISGRILASIHINFRLSSFSPSASILSLFCSARSRTLSYISTPT